jgi:hypothetical protein
LSRKIEDNKIKPNIMKIFLKICLGHVQNNAGQYKKVHFRAGRCRTVQKNTGQYRKKPKSAG